MVADQNFPLILLPPAHCTAVLIAITRIAVWPQNAVHKPFVGRAPPGFARGAYRTWLARPSSWEWDHSGRGRGRKENGRRERGGKGG